MPDPTKKPEPPPRQPNPDQAYAAAERLYVLAAAGVVVGLAIAGSLDRTIGGIVFLAAWAAAVRMLHRLGRTGSERSGIDRRDAEKSG